MTKSSLTKQPQIDRFDFLNEQFEENEAVQSGLDEFHGSLDLLTKEEKKTQETYLYHQPYHQETAYKTLEKMRDTSLFDSNADLIKSEIEKLVTQTVQIGPVQASTETSRSGAKSAMLSNADARSEKSLTR